MMWFLYVAGAILYFLLTSKEDFYRICTFLFSGMTISLIICTFFRNGTDFRPALDPGKNGDCSRPQPSATAFCGSGNTCQGTG